MYMYNIHTQIYGGKWGLSVFIFRDSEKNRKWLNNKLGACKTNVQVSIENKLENRMDYFKENTLLT